MRARRSRARWPPLRRACARRGAALSARQVEAQTPEAGSNCRRSRPRYCSALRLAAPRARSPKASSAACPSLDCLATSARAPGIAARHRDSSPARARHHFGRAKIACPRRQPRPPGTRPASMLRERSPTRSRSAYRSALTRREHSQISNTGAESSFSRCANSFLTTASAFGLSRRTSATPRTRAGAVIFGSTGDFSLRAGTPCPPNAPQRHPRRADRLSPNSEWVARRVLRPRADSHRGSV